MYKYKPTWAICPKAFENASTSQQVLMVFTDALHWLQSYAEKFSMVFLRSEIIYDQFTIRFRYNISEEESKVVLDYLTTVCAVMHSFRKDVRTKICVSMPDHDSNSFNVDFSIYFESPF